MKIVSNHYEFNMDISKQFGDGRYVGSSLKDFNGSGWAYSIEQDKDLSFFIGQLAVSSASLDLTPLYQNFSKAPDLFYKFKINLLGSDLSKIVDIYLGWREYETMIECFSGILRCELSSGEISQDCFDYIFDRFCNTIEKYLIASKIYDNLESKIILGIKSCQSFQSLIEYLSYNLKELTYEVMREEVIEYIRERR
jgi:hypothetical protein